MPVDPQNPIPGGAPVRGVDDPVRAGGRLALGAGLGAVALVALALIIVNTRESSSTSLPQGLAILGAILALGAILQGAVVCVLALRRRRDVPWTAVSGIVVGFVLLAAMAAVIAIAVAVGSHLR